MASRYKRFNSQIIAVILTIAMKRKVHQEASRLSYRQKGKGFNIPFATKML